MGNMCTKILMKVDTKQQQTMTLIPGEARIFGSETKK